MSPRESGFESDAMHSITGSLGFKRITFVFSCLILEHIHGNIKCGNCCFSNILLKMLIHNELQYFCTFGAKTIHDRKIPYVTRHMYMARVLFGQIVCSKIYDRNFHIWTFSHNYIFRLVYLEHKWRAPEHWAMRFWALYSFQPIIHIHLTSLLKTGDSQFI